MLSIDLIEGETAGGHNNVAYDDEGQDIIIGPTLSLQTTDKDIRPIDKREERRQDKNQREEVQDAPLFRHEYGYMSLHFDSLDARK